MPKKLLVLSFFIIALKLFSQENRKQIFGKVVSDSLAVGDVHIFNKNSRRGTISNTYGEFQIPIKENDTLIISDIQYESQQLVISKEHLNSMQLTIYLKPKVNELEEILVKEHNLSGNLTIDAENNKIISKVDESALDFSKMDLTKKVFSDYDKNDGEKPPDPSKLTDPNIPVGIDLMSLIVNPIFKELTKIGSKKRYQKHLETQYQEQAETSTTNIRTEFGDLFFTKILKIPTNQIDAFINHCKTKGVVVLYLNENKIATLDLLIKESEPYLKQLKDEN